MGKDEFELDGDTMIERMRTIGDENFEEDFD